MTQLEVDERLGRFTGGYSGSAVLDSLGLAVLGLAGGAKAVAHPGRPRGSRSGRGMCCMPFLSVISSLPHSLPVQTTKPLRFPRGRPWPREDMVIRPGLAR